MATSSLDDVKFILCVIPDVVEILSSRFYFWTTRHNAEQNKCKHDTETANTFKIGVSSNDINFKAFSVGVATNQNVAVQIW